MNRALRQVGKRNAALHAEAIACAEGILAAGPRSARWGRRTRCGSCERAPAD